MHYAYILQNYRNIQRINTLLPQNFNQTFITEVSYRNPLKSFFWNAIYSKNKSQNNLLYQAQILENGAKELLAVEQENDKIIHNLSSRLSKYLRKINTNLVLNMNVGIQGFQQILNYEITTIKNLNWGIGGKIETDFNDWFNTEYQSDWIFSRNQIQKISNNRVTQQIHLLILNFYPKDNHYLSLKSEYIKNNLYTEVSENIFTDIVYRYSVKKKNADIELQWNNIFNSKNFRYVNVDEFSYVETNFQLRPSQVVFKIKFSL